jgi:membrane-bound lytic murein transglycosylase F
MLFPLILAILIPLSFPGQKMDRPRRIKESGHIIVITRNNAHCWYTYRGEPMGFEYDLAKAFADYLGVDLLVKTTPWVDMIDALDKGEGDFIAASLTVTPSREEHVDFSNEYLSIQQRVIIHDDNYAIRELANLRGKTIHIRRGTSYEERLQELKEEGFDIKVTLYDDTPTEELIRRVANKKIEITIADSNIALLNRRYYPEVKIGIPIEEPQSLAWAVKKGDKALLTTINAFFEAIKTDGMFRHIYDMYYRNVEIFDRFDVKKFHERINTRLPRYKAIIKRAAKKYGFDWRLIVAIMYQESHFDPKAKSHRGVRGLMQLTESTAKEMGVTNRLDAQQSIMGGVKYLKKLYQRYDEAQDLDRMLITLAGYNVGPRHVSDAQRIARKKGLDPYKWSSLEKTLPLLCYEKYMKTSKFGYCRGTEPVRYVNRILLYYDILKRQIISPWKLPANLSG